MRGRKISLKQLLFFITVKQDAPVVEKKLLGEVDLCFKILSLIVT